MKSKNVKIFLIILLLSIVITFTFDRVFSDDHFNITGFLLNVIYGLIIGGSLSLSGVISSSVVKWFNADKNPVRVYVILLISVFIYITIDVFAINILWYRYVHDISYERLFSKNGLVVTSLITIFIGLIIFFIMLSRVYMNKFLESEKEKHKAEEDAASAKFETLKSQINPHFLFNSLNTLSTLIHVDTDRADRFTTQLSSIYRYVLDNQDEELVSIQNEMEFGRRYAFLQSIRFSDNFTINFHEYEGEEYPMIVPMSLQLLLENVFKHNIVSQRKPVNIEIYFEDDFVVVRNNKNPRAEVKSSHSVGLNNIMNRYEILSDKEIIIEDTTKYFTVKLPLIYTD